MERKEKRSRWLWPVTVSVVAILFLTAALPLLPVDQWWIRIGDYPRPQLLVAYLIMLPAMGFFRHRRGAWVAASALLVAAAIQLFWIHPYLPWAARQVQQARSQNSADQLRLMAANVLEDNQNAQALLGLVAERNPDLLVLCEVTHRWANEISELNQRFLFNRVHPLENGYGLAIYSQLDVSRCELRGMVKDSIPSFDADVVLRNGHTVRVFAIHPNPPRPGEDTTKRDAELILVGREVQDDPSVIVLGDMNDVGWSRTSDLFRETSGLLDPRIGRGFYPTFDATSWIMRYPLDYVFHSDDFRVAHLEVLPSIGSDHFPLWIQLSHEPSAEPTQNPPDLDAGDREDASDAVESMRDMNKK